ncbi:MAG: hypothetical protein OEV28_14025, partial [Nitrospirota bacterium]|nr:hypothetical protein [Nitrospirota bacterium]
MGGFVLLALFLRFGQFNEKLRAMAVERTSAELKHPVEIDRLVINLFPAYVDIKGFRIKAADGHVLFSSKSARGYLSWGDILLHKKIDLRQVAVDDPVLAVSRPQEGDFTIAPLVRELHRLIVEPPKGPYKVDIREVRVSNGTLNLDDAVTRIKGVASQVSGDMLKRRDALQISVRTDKGRLTLADGHEVPFAIDGRVKESGGKTELESLSIASRNSRLTLAGKAGESDGTVTFDGDASLEARLDEWHDLVPALEGLGGKLAIKAKVKGPVDNLDASGSIKGDLVAGKPLLKAGLPVSDISAQFRANKGGLNLSGLTAAVVDGQAKGDISLVKSKGQWLYQLAASLEQGSLKKLQDLFAVAELVTSGTVNLRAELSGNLKEPSSVRGKAGFSAAPVMAPAAGMQGALLSGIRETVGVIAFGPEGFILEQGSIVSALYSGTARGSIGKDRSLKLSVDGSVPDVMPLIKAAGYEKLRGQGRVSGVVSGTLDAPVFTGKATMKNALWNGVEIASADGDIILSKEKLTSPRILLIQGKGSYLFDGEIRFDKDVFYDARV